MKKFVALMVVAVIAFAVIGCVGTAEISVELDYEKLELWVGDTITLNATVSSDTDIDKSVQWSSDDTEVAEVSSEGVVTAKTEGTALITVTTKEGNQTASMILEVVPAIGRGNTVGNISNRGLAATDGTWVYFKCLDNSKSTFGSIYRMRTDGSAREKLNNENSWYINVCGGWIYYRNWSDGGIYRMRTDGSAREQLTNDPGWYINVVDGWIYYIKRVVDGPRRNHSIYRMRIDGSDREKLNDDLSKNMNVVDGWIYYTNWDWDDGGSIYRMRIDGSGREKLNSDTSLYINVVDGWIYYSNWDDRGIYRGIFRMRTDGSAREQLSSYTSEHINVVGGWIYYSRWDDGWTICRMRTDGAGKEELFGIRNDDKWLNVVDDWIYYSGGIAGETWLSRINIDGTVPERLP